jgi:hypothetical protein
MVAKVDVSAEDQARLAALRGLLARVASRGRRTTQRPWRVRAAAPSPPQVPPKSLAAETSPATSVLRPVSVSGRCDERSEWEEKTQAVGVFWWQATLQEQTQVARLPAELLALARGDRPAVHGTELTPPPVLSHPEPLDERSGVIVVVRAPSALEVITVRASMIWACATAALWNATRLVRWCAALPVWGRYRR